MDQFRLTLALIGVALVVLIYFLSRRSGRRPREFRQEISHETAEETAHRTYPDPMDDTFDDDLDDIIDDTSHEIPQDDFQETIQAAPPEKSARYRIPMSGDVNPPERPYRAAMEQEQSQPRKSRKRYVKFLSGADKNRAKDTGHFQIDRNLEPLTVVVYVMPLPGITFRREQVLRCLQSLGCVPRSDAGYDYVILDRTKNKNLQRLFMITDAHAPGIFARDEAAADKTNGLILEMRLPGPMDSVMAFEKLLDIARLIATKLNGVVCDDLQNRLTKQATMHIKDRILDHNRKMRFTQSSSLQ
jgi:FtsZ-interacting cell division protein ZipA